MIISSEGVRGTSDDPQDLTFVGLGTTLEVPPMENIAENSFIPSRE